LWRHEIRLETTTPSAYLCALRAEAFAFAFVPAHPHPGMTQKQHDPLPHPSGPDTTFEAYRRVTKRETLQEQAAEQHANAFRSNIMHSAIIAGTFLLMILSPCLVAMRSGATDEE